MDSSAFFSLNIWSSVNCFSKDIEHVAKYSFAHRDTDRSSHRDNDISSPESIGGVHSDTSDDPIFQQLQDFYHDFIAISILVLYKEGIIDLRHI